MIIPATIMEEKVKLRMYALDCAIQIGKSSGLTFTQADGYDALKEADRILEWLTKAE